MIVVTVVVVVVVVAVVVDVDIPPLQSTSDGQSQSSVLGLNCC